jgi:uncharacterized protein (TIGR03118 family)
MTPRFKRSNFALTTALALVILLISSTAMAQYAVTKLTANQTGKAKHTDALLQNGWGLAYGPGNPFWLNDEGSGWSTLYDGQGNPQSLQVVVPAANGGQGSPSGIAYNGSSEFQIENWASAFLFATLDGTIQGWSHFEPGTTLMGVDNSTKGAVYTGLGVTARTSGNDLYVANFVKNTIEMYDGRFNFVKSFTDSKVPKGFAPFNIEDINGTLYVTFAATNGGPGGYVDTFKEDGTLLKRLIHGKPLNQPWGLAIAPKNFGPLSGTLLVANNVASSTISGFNLKTGKLVGTMMGTNGKPIKIDGLWGIEFGGGSKANGKTNQLFFAAGPDGEVDGLFGVINSKK